MTDFDLSGFMVQFFEEAKERLASVNRKLVLLESGKLDTEGLSQLCRDAHTIKGSAEMLGIKDISSLSHLLEDAVGYVAKREPGAGSDAITQFLFDLHDQLQQRLHDPDSESRIDSAPLIEQFNHLCAEERVKSAAVPSPPVNKPRRPRPKKMRVNRNIIAAVMGSIEGSLQKGDKPGKPENPEAEETGSQPSQQPLKVEDICFRPDVESLEEQVEKSTEESSGSFLRVDRSRLNRLSNQIIELGSDRYRGGSIDEEFEGVMLDFKLLRQQLFSSGSVDDHSIYSSEFDQRLRELHKLGEQIRLHQKRSSAMLDDLRNQVFGLMLRPISSLFAIFPRTVRDLAARSGKRVRLLVSGDAIEMDQLAAEALSEPLIHLINNAVAHGIELPEERVAAGKPEEAQITIQAKQQGTEVSIEVMDDGKGIDVDRLREKAISSSIISSDEADEMDAAEILELIFHPGFSTMGVANESAGRGIGLNVVLNVMRELTGSVHIQTQAGKGSKFILKLPVSTAIQKANTFIVAGQQFGMLSNLIEKVLPLESQKIEKGQGAYHQGYITYDGHRVPVIDLYPVLNPAGQNQSGSSIMIIEHFEGYLGVLVDEVLEQREIIVREIDPYLKYYHPVGLMGNAIADDGSVMLLIEPNGLKEMWRTSPEYDFDGDAIEKNPAFNHHMLLVDDSSIALKLEKRIFEAMGFTVDTAVGGMDALQKMELNSYQLLITDMNMPNINGVELIERLRSDASYKELPILVIATRASESESKRAMKAGATAFIGKRSINEPDKELTATLMSMLAIDEEGG